MTRHRGHRGLSPLATLLLALAPPAALAAGAQVSLSLHVIETSAQGAVDLARPQGVELRLHVADAERFASSFDIPGARILGEELVALTLPIDPFLPDEPVERHLQATWVVDFDQPELASAAAMDFDLSISTPAALVARLQQEVDALLPEKTSRHGLLIASQAVRAGGGDCTEHAVVTAALARARGFPARVVTGWVLVDGAAVLDELPSDAPRFATLGHAWAEVWQGGRWHLADTALAEESSKVRYVPQAEWSNEGAGYAAALLPKIALLPRRVELVVTGD